MTVRGSAVRANLLTERGHGFALPPLGPMAAPRALVLQLVAWVAARPTYGVLATPTDESRRIGYADFGGLAPPQRIGDNLCAVP
jgi:hypothetical protein